MRKRFVRSWIPAGVLGALVAGSLGAPLAFAAQSGAVGNSSATNGSPGQGLEISPPVVELSANPGQTVTTQISVRDVTSGELIAKAQADDFGAGTSESGQPQLLLNETGATRYSLKYWVSPLPDMDLAPQQLKTTTVTIRVPANAEPGGHYGVVRFTAVPPNLQGTGVALSASVGTLILLKVNGPVTDKLALAEFSTGRSTNKGTVWVNQSFFEIGPVDFLVRLRNEGTVHEQPAGNITVKSLWGRTLVTINVNPTKGNVLPGSIRRFTTELNDKRLFGYYKATLALTYTGNRQINATVGFWVVPWRLLLMVLIGLIALVLLLRWGLRKYNNHIIARARSQK